MSLILAILFGKSISYFTRLFKLGGGSAAPGLYALKICPALIKNLSQSIPKNVVITGTNGKTTTAKMLAHFAKSNGLKVIRNHTGSNLDRGIASTLIQNSTVTHLGTRLEYDLGIWELDEAAFNAVAPQLKPDIIVFLNVFRDQLDRYGEIDTITKNWCQTLKKIPAETLLLVNGDDVNTTRVASCFSGKSQKFGVENYKISGEAISRRKKSENLDFEAKNVKLNKMEGSRFLFKTDNHSLSISLPMPGIYHIYDALAALTCASLLKLPTHRYAQMLKSYSPAFGRVEKLPFGYIFLIKNPAGATAVFETIAPNLKPEDRLLVALNDNIADGTDVSWIWDASFEKLQPANYNLQTICSGTRAEDLAVRLKYAGIDLKKIEIESDLERALRKARNKLKGNLYILPTYTAMLKLQSILAKKGIKRHYWKESD